MAADPTMSASEGFLRNHERVGAVVMELLTGNPLAADRAVVAVLEAWRGPGGPPGEQRHWPVRFWQGLLRQPGLPAGRPVMVGALADLARIPVVPRTVVLLRLVGLGQAEVAAAMGVPGASVAKLLDDALPRLGDGSVDGGAWQRWHAALDARAHALAPQRALRFAAARAGRPVVFPIPAPQRTRRTPRSLPSRHALGWIAAGTALALALTWVWPLHGSGDGLADTPRIRTRELRDAPLPAVAGVASQSGVIGGDGPVADAAVIAALPFYAWYAHERGGKANARSATPPPDNVPETPQDDSLETNDAP